MPVRLPSPLPHKDIVFPEVDLSDDDGEPGWETADEPDSDGFCTHRRKPGQHAAYWQVVKDAWERTVTRYEADSLDFYACWRYLNDHPVYWRFRPPPASHLPANHVLWLETDYGFGSDAVNVSVYKTDDNGVMQENPLDNTNPEIWLETGKWELLPNEHGIHTHYHDYELDTGASTFEDAVIMLARAVYDAYGNDRRIVDQDPDQVAG